MSDRFISTQSIHAIPATALRQVGKTLSTFAARSLSDWQLHDTYRLDHGFAHGRLSVKTDHQNELHIAENTKLGQPGAHLTAVRILTFLSPYGQTCKAVQLVEQAGQDHPDATYLVPFTVLYPRVDYTLVDIDTEAARGWMSDMPCLSFAYGTHLTMSSGEPRRVEQLRVGDRVLTQDAGPQEIRWIGRTLMPARGKFSPVLITAGALGNSNDLVVGPNHKLSLSPNRDGVQAGDSELMVKARHLVNGSTIRLLPGDQMEYVQILFDRHHLVFVEGIAAEATLMHPRTKPSLPPELLDRLKGLMPGRKSSKHTGFDVQQALLSRPDAFDLIRRASTR